MKRLLDSYRALPRAARWGLMALGVLAGYFLVIEPVLDRTVYFSTRADTIENNLRRASDLASEDSDDGRAITTGVRAFGRPQAPDLKTRPESVQRVVDEVLEDHGVTNRTKTERTSTLTSEKARAIAGGDAHIDRAIVEVSFEADQSVVARIIADLEASPVITAVSRVKIDRSAASGRFSDEPDKSPGKVRATISAESWIIVRSRAGGEGDSTGGEPL